MDANNWLYYMIKSPQAWQQFFESHNRIFFYGAGMGASMLASKMKNMGVNVDGILVGDGHLGDVEISRWDIPVQELSQAHLQAGDGIIITLQKESQPAILDYLLACGIAKKNIFCQNFFGATEGGVIDESYCLAYQLTGFYFSKEEKLDAIGRKYGTDKSSAYHDYLKKYEYFLDRYRDKPINVLEFGVLHGESLSMWEEYFTEAAIFGVDIDRNCLKHQSGRKQVIIADLGQIDTLKKLREVHPTIIIDDASHFWSHQIMALFTLWECLPSGGIYILEDLGTSFPSYHRFGCDDANISAYQVLSAIAEVATGKEKLNPEGKTAALLSMTEQIESIGREVDMISFIHESCMMIKA